MLRVKGLHVQVDGKAVLQGVDIVVQTGEIHALMGPNGSGKSSLALMLAGHPAYSINGGGKAELNGKDIFEMSPEERVKAGLFLSFQAPVAVPGVSYFSFLKQSYQAVSGKHVAVLPFRRRLEGVMSKLGIDVELLQRSVNDGFSGGERKKMEIVQMSLIQPKLIVLDEIDSGLDVDSLKLVARTVRDMADSGAGVMVITHYRRVLEYLKPDKVTVMKRGRVVASGGEELVKRIEEQGYGKL